MSAATLTRRGSPAKAPGTRPGGAPALVGAAAAAALLLAIDAGVEGPAAVPDTARGALAAAAFFALCGLAPALALTPSHLRPWLPLLLLPFGAAASGLALTALGFLQVPFDVSLGLVLGLAAVTGAIGLRRAGWRLPAPASERLAWPVLLALLVMAIALIPTMRNGYATVVGQNGDAELAVGAVELLKVAPPAAVREDLPLDRMPGVWRSKYPIYYPLAAVSRLSGLEPYQVFATQMALLYGLLSLSLFLFARRVLGAGPIASLAAMFVVPLNRILVYVAIHPFHNQLWGTLALVLTLIFGIAYLRAPSRRGAVALALFGGLGASAYPLLLWMPALVLGLAGAVIARERRRAGESTRWLSALRLPRGRRSLLVWVPLGVLAFPFVLVLLAGIVEKSVGAAEVVLPGSDLTNWRSADGFLPFPRFFGIPGESVVSHLAAGAVLVIAALGLRGRPRDVALPLAGLGVVALAVAAYFRARTNGDLFYFKDLSLFAPFVLTLAVVWLVERIGHAARPLSKAAAGGALAVLAACCLAGTRAEVADTYDLLNRDLLQLRTWSAQLPAGSSIRLDLAPDGYQLWARHMLHEHPLSASRVLENTIFPHPPRGRKADYVLSSRKDPRPPDARGRALFDNRSYRLYEMDPTVPGPDVSSRRLVDAWSASFD